MSISAVINTKNASETIARTLRSLDFVDEVVVADMQSSDTTVKIAQSYGATVITVPDSEYVEPARNTAIAAAKSEWVLIIDADEVVPKQLRELLRTLTEQKSETIAYYIPRRNSIFAYWFQHTGWWPDYVLRLFKKGSVTWKDQIHSAPVVSGATEQLPADPEQAIQHYNYISVGQFIEKLQRYTSIEATTRKTAVKSPITAFSQEFCRRVFAEKGLQDGNHGVAAALLQSFYEVVVVLKQWQKDDFPHTKTDALAELEQLNQDLAYWIATEKIQRTTGLQQLLWKVRRRVRV